MDFTGKLLGIQNNVITGECEITFACDNKNMVLSQYEKIKDKKLTVKAVQFRKKRSIDANAYMWVLLSKIANLLNTDKWNVYLEMLSRYGVFTHVIVKESAVEKVKAEWRTVRELGEINVNGSSGIQLQCYFGSSTYDTKEMSVLIDGVVSEAKELGIETLAPGEIERMKEEWKKQVV